MRAREAPSLAEKRSHSQPPPFGFRLDASPKTVYTMHRTRREICRHCRWSRLTSPCYKSRPRELFARDKLSLPQPRAWNTSKLANFRASADSSISSLGNMSLSRVPLISHLFPMLLQMDYYVCMSCAVEFVPGFWKLIIREISGVPVEFTVSAGI